MRALSNAELTLQTARLTLRPYAAEDLDLSQELLSDPVVMKYIGDIKDRAHIMREHAKLICRGAGGCIGIWCVILTDTAEKIGEVGLTPLPVDAPETDWDSVVNHRFPDAPIEAGYTFLPASWGNGYATEACRRIIQFGFEMTNLEKIVAVTDLENTASMHVLQKCGLQNDGRRRAYQEDVTAFSISRADWQTHTH